VITRVAVYCLVLWDLKIHEPSKFKLFASSTENIYPNTEINISNPVFTALRSGRTAIQSVNNGGGGDGDEEEDEEDGGGGGGVTFSDYEYRKYDLEISMDRQILMNFLRISMDFVGDNWIFISEVEVYHVEMPGEPFTHPIKLYVLLIAEHY